MSARTVLITGGNGGLGQGIARAFLAGSPDTRVWLGVHSNRAAAEQAAAAHPGRCRWVALDVTQADSWSAAVDEIAAAGQSVDVLVNNAGRYQDALLATMPETAWRSVLDANLTGAFLGCQAVLSQMISRRWGRIINVASLSALLAPAGQSNYAAAKAGLVALTRALAKEVARIGITVNAICPGYIETGALAEMEVEARRAALARVPMRRFGQPEEVAAAVRFLACPEAGYITGSVLKIDGGIL